MMMAAKPRGHHHKCQYVYASTGAVAFLTGFLSFIFSFLKEVPGLSRLLLAFSCVLAITLFVLQAAHFIGSDRWNTTAVKPSNGGLVLSTVILLSTGSILSSRSSSQDSESPFFYLCITSVVFYVVTVVAYIVYHMDVWVSPYQGHGLPSHTAMMRRPSDQEVNPTDFRHIHGEINDIESFVGIFSERCQFAAARAGSIGTVTGVNSVCPRAHWQVYLNTDDRCRSMVPSGVPLHVKLPTYTESTAGEASDQRSNPPRYTPVPLSSSSRDITTEEPTPPTDAPEQLPPSPPPGYSVL